MVELVESTVTQIDRIEASCSRSVPTAANLRRAILAEAFSGNLVPQDPADESSEALLVRTRAEPTNGVSSRKPRTKKKATA